MLIILGGLPGAGKSTIAKLVAARRNAVYVRVDEIECALSRHTGGEVGALGYVAAYAAAVSNLKIGFEVVADSVNAVAESREGWRECARRAGRDFTEVEVICSDTAEHRRRVEKRSADIDGLVLPTWTAVSERPFLPWPSAALQIDTATIAPEAAADMIDRHLAAKTFRIADLPGTLREVGEAEVEGYLRELPGGDLNFEQGAPQPVLRVVTPGRARGDGF